MKTKTLSVKQLPMKAKRLDRAIAYAQHIVDHDATIRATAKYFGDAPSTVHYYIHNYLGATNPELYASNRILYNKVLEVFDAHISRVRSQLPIKRMRDQEAK